MQIFKEIGALKAFLLRFRNPGSAIGLVPTMGALHEGHLSLVAASKATNSITVCSIFVNPGQFNNAADLEKYPRTPEKDQEALERAGCDVLFIPGVEEMYDKTGDVKITLGTLDTILEGEFRPGHFSGVAVVVSKLFNIVLPTHVYFGQKDYQQFCVISLLVKELKFDLVLHCMPTVRDADGLAMSSRNLRLTPAQRQIATIFYQCLVDAKHELLAGSSWASVKTGVSEKVGKLNDVRLEYFHLADKRNLDALEKVNSDAILLVAGYVGDVRLIDNLFIK
jgi:pantoate--beta-alanine ligase